MSRTLVMSLLLLTASVGCSSFPCGRDELGALDRIASQDPKPFIVIGNERNGFGQGVIISDTGWILTAAHVTFDEKRDRYPQEQNIFFRTRKEVIWPEMVGRSDVTYSDAGHRKYWQEQYKATLIRDGNNPPHIDGRDIALLRLSVAQKLPHIDFYSKSKPRLRIGDRLYLCHYCYPDDKADPIFLITPMTVIGIAENTTRGTQILAQGFFRFGSSGGAILKDGKLIGIQSNGYMVNPPGGETVLGHLSFELVYEDIIAPLMKETPTAK